MKPNSRRALMKFLCLVLGLILALMLALSFYVQHLLGQVHYIPQQTEESLTDTVDNLLQPDIHILLIGQDRLPGEDRARSDCMILCDFSPEEDTITMTSFLRDLYVQIPGYGANRLNAAYALGGMELLEQTLEENFGVSIDGCLEVDFQGFPQLVDLLGGVQAQLRQDEAQALNSSLGCALAEGPQTLTGQQALAYARLRKLDADGDFSRTKRQRKLLTSLLEGCRDQDSLSLLSLLEKALPLLTTDLTGPQLLKTGIALLPMLPDAQVLTRHIPADGTYQAQTIDGMSVLVPDLQANRDLLSGE